MLKFSKIVSVAAALPIANLDTDMVIPAQFMKTTERTGLGKYAFYKLRYDNQGKLITDFILNISPYNQATILLAGENFGCGSSREHAPWALLDLGIRCIIAPSFADIFYQNSSKNGLLLIKLPSEQLAELTTDAQQEAIFTVDLANQQITTSLGTTIHFIIEQSLKHQLLEGLDEIDLTLQKIALIEKFETQQKISQPWL